MRFFFHYNKIQSRIKGYNILTLHYKGKCHLVKDIRCNVPIETAARKYQPRCVLRGRATRIDIVDEKAYIL
jgi:hypothetical protein